MVQLVSQMTPGAEKPLHQFSCCPRLPWGSLEDRRGADLRCLQDASSLYLSSHHASSVVIAAVLSVDAPEAAFSDTRCSGELI